MILGIRSRYKTLYVFILAATCYYQLDAFKLVLVKKFSHNIDFRAGDAIYDNLLFNNEKLACFGGGKIFQNCSAPTTILTTKKNVLESL